MAGTISLSFVANSDDVFLYWKVGGNGTIENCLGFAVRQTLKRESGVTTDWLKNRVGFTDQPAEPGETRPSTDWPFQRYSWTDHDVGVGDLVKYRVYPVIKDAQGHLTPDEAQASDWTPEIPVKSTVTGKIACYFNRGVSASQFVARYLVSHKISKSKLVDSIGDHASSLRSFMGGQLLEKLLGLLDEAIAAPKSKPVHVHASLFELRDEDLVSRLEKLGSRLHIVLADGSPKAADPDPNLGARKRLKKAGAELIDRKVAWDAAKKRTTGALSHNKFVVFVDNKIAARVWTGSTNWTPSGLCTQVNNAVLIDDRKVAAAYLSQWQRLAKAKSNPPSDLSGTNPAPVKAGTAILQPEIWFTPTKKSADIAALQAVCGAAQQGILFLMFMPGEEPLGTIVQKQQAGLYVRGVTNQYVSSAQAAISLYSKKGAPSTFKDHAPNPSGIKTEFAYWLDEVQLNTLGVLIHSKLIVADPFGPNPVVVVGSHNYSKNASTKNDENFLIIRGNSALARAYATNIIGVYQHYRWRQYVKEHPDPWHKLNDKPAWQDGYFDSPDEVTERDFWMKA